MEWIIALGQASPTILAVAMYFLWKKVDKIEKKVESIDEKVNDISEKVAYLGGRVNGLSEAIRAEAN